MARLRGVTHLHIALARLWWQHALAIHRKAAIEAGPPESPLTRNWVVALHRHPPRGVDCRVVARIALATDDRPWFVDATARVELIHVGVIHYVEAAALRLSRDLFGVPTLIEDLEWRRVGGCLAIPAQPANLIVFKVCAEPDAHP